MNEKFSPPPYNQQVVHSRRMAVGITAVVLAVCQLGWIGIPKYMMGYERAGTITLVATVCSCFSAILVFNVLTLIEGIVYLRKTDEEFYETYIAGRKEWL